MTLALTTLISAADLRAALARGEAPVMIDASFDLADPAAGEAAWRDGHPPGAHYLQQDSARARPRRSSRGGARAAGAGR